VHRRGIDPDGRGQHGHRQRPVGQRQRRHHAPGDLAEFVHARAHLVAARGGRATEQAQQHRGVAVDGGVQPLEQARLGEQPTQGLGL
jgi:hypothetical protein